MYVDGKEVSSVTADKVFNWKIALTGEHTITAVSGTCRDEMKIRKVDAPNPAYSISKGESITNWFDQDDFKEGFYSIKDTLGALMADPKTAPIIQQIMAKSAESRGDVAKSTMKAAFFPLSSISRKQWKKVRSIIWPLKQITN